MSNLASLPHRITEGRWKSHFLRYAIALSIVGVAVLLRLWLDPMLARSGFAIFLVAMLAAAWVGGIGPCLVAQTLILASEGYWFAASKPPGPPAFSAQAIVGLIAFYSVGLTVAILSELWHAAQRRAREQRNEALAQRERLRVTFSCMGDGVIVADRLGCVTSMNPAAETMTGWSSDEAKGFPLRDVFAVSREKAGEENPINRVLHEGEILYETVPLTLIAKSGRQLPIAYSAAPVRDASPEKTGIVLVFRDESDRKRAEEALHEADRRKDEFVATLAHELRNPLAPICMGLDLIKISPGDADTLEEVRAMMERQAQHMVRLIDDLLDVSRITRGKLELRKSHVFLAEIVRSAIEVAKPALDDARHELQVRLPDRPVLLFADTTRLTQVLSNLLNNAAKFTPPGGKVELTAERLKGEIIVTIADNGPGIAADKLEQIFEMFSQIDNSVENGRNGLGIGLTLVKRLIEMHGGAVEVESQRGIGSRFRVRLPLPDAAPDSELPSDLPDGGLPVEARRLRVLAVDDNADALLTLSRMIELLGHESCTAANGLEAIEAAERFAPDVVFMDIGMPKMNGYDAAKRLRELPVGKNAMLVATTGWGQEEDRRRTQEADYDLHLVKPVQLTAIKSLLEEFEKRAASREPLERSATTKSDDVENGSPPLNSNSA